MEKKWELGSRRTRASLKEQAARTVLRKVRAQGHTYVELREDNNEFIFFCTLCLSRCYGDSTLSDHLKGNPHNKRLAAAKVTLFGPNPWPFNDGFLFFDSRVENDRQLEDRDENSNDLLENRADDSLAISGYDTTNEKKTCSGDVRTSDMLLNIDNALNCGREIGSLLVPKVLTKEVVSDLHVSFLGVGKIAARFLQSKNVVSGISRIWCEWVGSMADAGHDLLAVPKHDFAIVVFGFDYDLGRKGLMADAKSLLYSSPPLELESVKDDHGHRTRKRSFSDSKDMSESRGSQFDSGEDPLASINSSPKLLLAKYDDQILRSRIISSKAARRELRKNQRIAAEKMCDICQQNILPGKDVATLLNLSTGKLACSSRNLNGAFHIFHISCLIQWVLLCESEIAISQLGNPKAKQKSRMKKASPYTKNRKVRDKTGTPKPILAAFCPECQGTGIITEGNNLENPSVPLSEIYNFKLKMSVDRGAWMKNPELLQNCSVGFHFSPGHEVETQEMVLPLKLLHFYVTDDWPSRKP